MARPKSMPNFESVLDVSRPVSLTHPRSRSPDKSLLRKKPSISLAAGLIMNNDPPRSPTKQHIDGREWCEGLFYAYAQKSDYAQSPPYVLTFSSAVVAEQWWSLVQREYPESTREGPQLFILKGDDMQEQIQDNPRFYELHNKWFYAPSDSSTPVIPLQDYKGHPLNAIPITARRVSQPAEEEEKKEDISGFDMKTLNETLKKMNAMIFENSAQIRALSVAQSAGLQTMQTINESNSTQIKALADNQSELQQLVEKNASHYIALSNSSFTNQEQVREVLKSNAQQIKALADGQNKLAAACAGMTKTIENLSNAVSQMNVAGSDAGSVSPFNSRTCPPPRKLNRRVKSVWYEYDGSSPMATPRRSIAGMETPPKTPASTRAPM
ncbi:hypothetical protein CC78DRAFT_577401 [Lojkania enalia]|uniref:Uncharacterized protein n=1 Tax=Lojkania enalia TaxID=147567 RepID=A0A9P4KDF9_9PLEO|nr:hypothetical protein CC78DRAFT_577401 [Didymosphaeria enalia]